MARATYSAMSSEICAYDCIGETHTLQLQTISSGKNYGKECRSE